MAVGVGNVMTGQFSHVELKEYTQGDALDAYAFIAECTE